jgi:hypothetical protein
LSRTPGIFGSWREASAVLGGCILATYVIAAVCYGLGRLTIALIGG